MVTMTMMMVVGMRIVMMIVIIMNDMMICRRILMARRPSEPLLLADVVDNEVNVCVDDDGCVD